MNKKILTQAKNVLAQKKLHAETLAEQSRINTTTHYDEFKLLYQDYISCMIENAKNGGLKKQVDDKKQRCDQWLSKNNLSSIFPVYSCKHCEDTGYIDGKMCDCLKREITKILITQSGFGKLESFEQADFSKFQNPEEMKKLYTLMQNWCNQNPPTKTLIYLSGGTGVGKTHLVKCMANALIENSKVVNLVTAFSVNQDLVKAFTSFDNDLREQTLQKYLDCEYLFIDDLGTEIKQKGISVNMLYLILNERKMRGLSTIITSNLNINDIRDQYDERISSRIVDKTTSICIRLNGDDLRLK